MKQILLRLLVLMVFLASAAFMGCAHVDTSTDKAIGIIATSEAFKSFSGEFENTEYTCHPRAPPLEPARAPDFIADPWLEEHDRADFDHTPPDGDWSPGA